MQESQIQFPVWWPFCFQVKLTGTQFTWRCCETTPWNPNLFVFPLMIKKPKGCIFWKSMNLPSFSWPTFPFQGPPCSMVVLSLTASDLPRGSWTLIAAHVLEADRWVNYSHAGCFLEVSLLISGCPRVPLNAMDGDLINCPLLVKICYCAFERIQIPREA